ncbi:MATE family efflux transporter [Candidatus Thiothrix sp. Deng01]|uniref:MATE family efflux transporter n=1 Tax=Candidatus Thiothrix phosphatis TaxID=3112415 RepID=A0ABU6CUT7_9GAMM|nr:MATE family efflux transporter [Candidatus Thiothrix sp. Deng01]MEB4589833.1 MATE family efflux transporter [Candidatus Thiothrix sp. Deng01]
MNDNLPDTQSAWLRRVFHLAWPVILSNLSVPLVGMVDTAVMGRLPEAGFMAAVAVGAIIFSSVFWVFGFLRMGTTGFVAQASGKNSQPEVALAVLRALGMAVLLGALVILLQWPLGKLAFYLMGASEEVTGLARQYFFIRVWGAPFTFINYVLLGTLIGLQRMRAALLTQLALNISNMLLDLLFVLGLGMTVAGVALASVLGECLAAMTGLYLLRPVLRTAWGMAAGSACDLWEQVGDKTAIRTLFQVNADLFVRTLLLTSAFFFFTSQGAAFGTVVLAANAILLQMLQMIAYGLDGFAHAAEALVGSAYGGNDRRAWKQAIASSALLAFMMAAGISLLYWLAGSGIIRLLTDIQEVAQVAGEYLVWVVAAPLLAVWSYQLDGIFIGMTRTRDMRNTVALAVLVYVVLVWLTTPVWGNHALWACLLAFLSLRGVFLGVLLGRLFQTHNG